MHAQQPHEVFHLAVAGAVVEGVDGGVIGSVGDEALCAVLRVLSVTC